MSRHRNVRNYAYEEDLYEDVYGHSVEEHDLCVSPTTARQFLYRRGETEHPNLSSFMEEPQDEDEDEREYLGAQKDYKPPKLDSESQAKLLSCLDQFRSILGDNCDEEDATAAILKHDFDLEKAIDDVLSEGGNQDLKSHKVSRKEKDVLKIERISNSGCFQPNKVLAESQGSSVNEPSQTLNESKMFSPLGEVGLPSKKNPCNLLSEGRGNNQESGDVQHTRDMNTGLEGSLPLSQLMKTPKSEGKSKVSFQLPIKATEGVCAKTVNESSGNQLLEREKSMALKKTEASFIGKDAPRSSIYSLTRSEDHKLPLSQLLRTRPDDGNAPITHLLDRKPANETSSVSPLREYLVSKEKPSDGTVKLSTLGSPQDKGLISSPLSDIKRSPGNETKALKSLSELIEDPESSSRNQNSRLTLPMSRLNIKDESKSPLGLLLGSRQATENKTQVSTKMLPLEGQSNAEKFNLSPLSQLSKDKRSLVNTGSGSLSFNKFTSGEAGTLLNIKGDSKSPLGLLLGSGQATSGEAGTSQKMSPLIHIPKNEGSSFLSQLLKSRQSSKDLDCGRKECLDNNSNVNIGKDDSSHRAVFESGKSGLSKQQFPRDCQKPRGTSVDTSSASYLTKDIDLSTLLIRKKPDGETKNLAKHTDLVDGKIDRSSRLSLDVIEDGLQPIEVDESFLSQDSVVELLQVPSTFASTLLVCFKKPGRQKWRPTLKGLYQHDVGIVPFDFSTPSPDDIVLSKQKKARLKKK